jgi:hypothetical protein
MSARSVSVLAVLVLLTGAHVHAQVPAGGDFLIRSGAYVWEPAIASDARGNFATGWGGETDGKYDGVEARRYDATGIALGPVFQVNTYTTGHQGNQGPRIASDAGGDIVIVWYSFADVTQGLPSQDGSDTGVYAQRYHASGLAAGSEFRVNTYTTGNQTRPDVASDAAGNFVVVWWSDGQDGDGRGVFGQRYDFSGAPRGSEFQVNSYTTGHQYVPSVASDEAGNFVVVWKSTALSGLPNELRAQRYDSSGGTRGGEFQVAPPTMAYVGQASVRSNTDGSFAVVWTGRDSDLVGVFARKYDSSGAPVTGPFSVNTDQVGYQYGPSTSLDGAGRFVVVWSSRQATSPYNWAVRARRFEASGAPRGPEVTLPVIGGMPALSSDSTGNFVVATSRGFGGIAGQRFGGIVSELVRVDPLPSSASDGNGVLEPGEVVDVTPFWRNVNGAAQTFAGTAVGFTGPSAGGVSYQLLDAVGDYGTVANNASAPCTDCYRVSLTFGGERPGVHWDATFDERLTPDAQGQEKLWRLHVGDSFADVPRANSYYRFVETLLHHAVTGGCTPTTYCPDAGISRGQMAVFVIAGREGQGYVPPPCGAVPVFADVPVTSPFCPWIEELARRGVVSGCGGGNYCPTDPVTREAMAVFALRGLDPAINPPPCSTPSRFADVPATSPYCRWVEELARRQIVTGCGGGNYCPGATVTREQMAVFISVTFGLVLYGA